jgi:hypothetical protein
MSSLSYCVIYRPTGLNAMPVSETFTSSSAADARAGEPGSQGYLVFRAVGPSPKAETCESRNRRGRAS